MPCTRHVLKLVSGEDSEEPHVVCLVGIFRSPVLPRQVVQDHWCHSCPLEQDYVPVMSCQLSNRHIIGNSIWLGFLATLRTCTLNTRPALAFCSIIGSLDLVGLCGALSSVVFVGEMDPEYDCECEVTPE